MNLTVFYYAINWHKCLLDSALVELILFTAFLPIACLPACVDAGFHHATLGGLWRMWSSSGAYSSSQKGCSSQDRGCILTANFWRNHATPPPPSSFHTNCPFSFFSLVTIPTALRAALVQEGNYLSTPITSTPAILLTSAPDESLLLSGRVPRSIQAVQPWHAAASVSVWGI